jgi:hypothetical protein
MRVQKTGRREENERLEAMRKGRGQFLLDVRETPKQEKLDACK